MFGDRRVLVTGATGFIGANLARRLVREGAEVHLLARASSNLWRLEDVRGALQVHHVDLRDAERLRAVVTQVKPHLIYHCATFGGYPHQADAQTMIETNVQGTVNLVQALAAVSYECLVNTGSSSEYGLKAAPMREDDVLEPRTLYGVTKASATLFCQAVAWSTQQPIVTARLFSPYGPYEEPTRLIPTVIRACLEEKSPEVTSGEQVRDFVFIDDVVDGYLRLASSRLTPGAIINIGSGKHTSVREVVRRIVRLSETSVPPRWGTIPQRPHESTTWVADISKANALLGWQPTVDVDTGLQRTVGWFKEHMNRYAYT